MKLDTNPRIFNPIDEPVENYGKIPMLYSKYIFRSIPKDDLELEESSDDESSDLDAMLKSLKESENALPTSTQNIPLKLKDEQFPRILFLGTGASDSFLLRNSSAILVHLT